MEEKRLNKSDHCNLCSNIQTDQDDLIKCRITHELPNFQSICSDFHIVKPIWELKNDLEQNTYNHTSKRLKIIRNSLIYLLVSAAFFYIAFVVDEKTYERDNIHIFVFVLWIPSFLFLFLGGGLIVDVIKSSNTIKKDKEILYQIMRLYKKI